MQRLIPALAASVLLLAPLGARAATSWSGGSRGSIPRKTRRSGRSSPPSSRRPASRSISSNRHRDEIMKKTESALEAGAPPDFLFGATSERWAAQWAYEDRLVDLAERPRPGPQTFSTPTRIEVSTLLDGKTGRRGLYALPMGRYSNHVHAWNSLLERAGFSLADIPSRVGCFLVVLVRPGQPACARRLGRDDIWAVGLPMSARLTTPTTSCFSFSSRTVRPEFDLDHRAQNRRSRGRAGIDQSA